MEGMVVGSMQEDHFSSGGGVIRVLWDPLSDDDQCPMEIIIFVGMG